MNRTEFEQKINELYNIDFLEKRKFDRDEWVAVFKNFLENEAVLETLGNELVDEYSSRAEASDLGHDGFLKLKSEILQKIDFVKREEIQNEARRRMLDSNQYSPDKPYPK